MKLMHFRDCFCCLTLVACLLYPLAIASTIESDADDKHLHSLCERGLPHVAIAYCQARLSIADDQPGEVARWTMRWMEAEAQAALRAIGNADRHWQAAKQLLVEFEKRRADDPRLPWLRWQSTRNDLLKCQAALAAWLAAPALAAMREQALATVRGIEAELDKLDADIEHRLPLAAKQDVSRPTQAPSEHLLQLRLDASLLRCEAMMVRGQCYSKGSRDRIAAATNVSSIAQAALARVPREWPARASLLVALATANLELGQRSDALKELQRLYAEAASPLVQTRVATTIIDALISDGDLDSAKKWLETLVSTGDGPNTQLSRMRVRLAETTALAGEDKQTAMRQLVDMTKSIGDRYGDYWRGRADALVVGQIGDLGDSIGSRELGTELVLAEVRQLLAAKNDSEAIKKLMAATLTAKASGELAQSIEFAVQSYALLVKKREWLQATDALMPLSAELATTNGASEAHWLAIRGLRQALQSQPASDEWKRRYEAALVEQIRLWPDSTESEIAAQWLETWLLGLANATSLLHVLETRALESSKPETKSASLRRWLLILAERVPEGDAMPHRQWLVQQLVSGKLRDAKPTAEVVSVASSVLTRWPSREQQRELYAPLRAASGLPLSDVDRQSLIAVQILNATRAGELNLASDLRKSWIPQSLSAPLLRTWATRLVDAVDEQPFEEHVRWQPIVKGLPPWNELLAENPSLASIAASWRVIAWEGKQDLARTELTALMEKYPREGTLRLQLAHLLAEAGQASFAEALRLARQVATGSKKSSPQFIEARWLELRLLLASGKSDEARKIAAQTLLTQEIPSGVWLERLSSVAK